MAIRFVDKSPEDEPDHKRPPATDGKRDVLSSSPGPALDAAVTDPAEASDDPLPTLPYAKPVPKAKGRKPAHAATTPEPAQAPLDGLLPPLPLAKPDPKPRGRKKAFG